MDIDIKLRCQDDVETEKYCFTDGVSVAGSDVMTAAAKVLKMTNVMDLKPSAIQFRLGFVAVVCR